MSFSVGINCPPFFFRPLFDNTPRTIYLKLNEDCGRAVQVIRHESDKDKVRRRIRGPKLSRKLRRNELSTLQSLCLFSTEIPSTGKGDLIVFSASRRKEKKVKGKMWSDIPHIHEISLLLLSEILHLISPAFPLFVETNPVFLFFCFFFFFFAKDLVTERVVRSLLPTSTGEVGATQKTDEEKTGHNKFLRP